MGHPCSKFFKKITIPVSQLAFPDPQNPTLDFGFRATAMIFILDVGHVVEWNYNAQADNLDGIITCEDRSLVFDGHDAQKIWMRLPSTPTPEEVTMRIWAWEKQR